MHGEMSDDKASNLPTVSNWIFFLILFNRKKEHNYEKTMLFLQEIEHFTTPTFISSNWKFQTKNSHVIGRIKDLIVLSCTLDDYYTSPKPLEKHRQIHIQKYTQSELHIWELTYVDGIDQCFPTINFPTSIHTPYLISL